MLGRVKVVTLSTHLNQKQVCVIPRVVNMVPVQHLHLHQNMQIM